MDAPGEERADPYYDLTLTLASIRTGSEVHIDCGVILRAIDTLLMIAPKEFRTPKDWMLRLYRARMDITNAIEHEAEAALEIGGEDERPTTEDIGFLIGRSAGETFTDAPSPAVDPDAQDPSESVPRHDREGDW